jgi:tetratricopeptide (TPR) repeat protein
MAGDLLEHAAVVATEARRARGHSMLGAATPGQSVCEALRGVTRYIAIGLAALGIGATACAPAGLGEARSALRTNDLATARELLERDRRDHPRSLEVRLALGEVYYRSARDALDWEGDEGRYLAFLERSLQEFVAAAEIEPESPDAHLYFAVMDVYRGDLASALRGLENVRRLSPGPVADTNLAEVYIYLGRLDDAKRWNQGAYLSGSGTPQVLFNRMLIDWVEGDLAGARRSFEELRRRHPESIRNINLAPLPLAPRSFEQFARYCCESPACGPYLEQACDDLALPVTRRRISQETLLEELRLEMERRRRLAEVYRQRKELQIEVEGGDPMGGAAP